MKRSLLILLGCLCSLFIVAQTKPSFDKTLLWRISGNTLHKPSYLYGTMHLTDERLFNFSDSLLLAIEKSEGFAIELDPDEMMTLVMEQMFNDIKKARLLKDVVSKKAFIKYAPLLEKRLKIKQDEITVKDVVQEQNRWMQDAYNNGTMPTFVDTWLYDVARKQGKWVGGIEDVQDQAGLLEDVFNEQDLEFLTADYSTQGKKFLTMMIDTYEKQDIVTMENIMGESGKKDLLLLRRNRKMAYRMDSLSAVRSMVFAVGAAHLAGDSGVISLLREKGFTVEPVLSTKKIAGKNYKVASKPVAWQKITDGQGLYEVEMPGKASPVKMYGVLEMRLNFNLFTSSGYLTMAFPSALTEKNTDSMMLVMARGMMQDPKLKQGKAIMKNGLKGREYVGKGADGYKRAQAFSGGTTMYVACAFFKNETNVTGADAEHFFNSLVLHQIEAKKTEDVSFAGIFPGVEGKAPVALVYNKEITAQSVEKDWTSSVFTGLDLNTGSFYMLFSKATLNDTYIPNDSMYLNLLRENSRAKFEKLELDTLRKENDFLSLEQKGTYSEKNVYFHGKSFIKGNRCYSFFAIVPVGKTNEETANKIVATFKMVTPPATKWDIYTADHGNLNAWAPEPLLKGATEDSVENNNTTEQFTARDSNSSYAYTIVKTPIDTSFWYNGKQDYWDRLLDGYVGDEDSVLAKKTFISNNLDGYDFEISEKKSLNKTKRIRFFTNGDTLYTMFTCLPSMDVHTADVNRFFDDIKFTKTLAAATVFTSKAQQFIGRLYSADSATHSQSYYKLYAANFAKTDIPLLRTALMEHYDWDSINAFYTPVQAKIGEKLQNLGDSTLPDFIKSGYANQNGRDDEEQSCLLELLMDAPDSINQRFVIDRLKELDGNSKISETIIHRLDDSLKLVKPILSDALLLLNKKNMVAPTTEFAKRMLDSNLLKITDLAPFEAVILDFATTKLQDINAGEDGYGWPLAAAVVIAGRLKTPASLGLLKQMLGSRHNAVKMESIYGMLEAGSPLPPNVLLSVAGDRSLRSELWIALGKTKQESLFPKAFKTQQAMGEAGMYQTAYDEEAPTNIVFLSTQKTTINGKPANVYLYKVTMLEDESKATHLGIIAFPSDLKNIEALPYGSSLLWEEEYSVKNQAKQTKALLDEIKENMKPIEE